MSEGKKLWEIYQNSIECKICNKIFFGLNKDHCPHCLCSIHQDILPRDNKSNCMGVLKPLSRTENKIIHKCDKCGAIQYNPIYEDDNKFILKNL